MDAMVGLERRYDGCHINSSRGRGASPLNGREFSPHLELARKGVASQASVASRP